MSSVAHQTTFDIAALNIPEAEKRQTLKLLAQAAEGSDRFRDMCGFMRELVVYCTKANEELTTEERNLLSVAFKNVVGAHRAAHRTLTVMEWKDKDEVQTYKRVVEEELEGACADILDLLEKCLLPQVKGKENEAEVFFLKMLGDYYRYMAEIMTDKGYDNKAHTSYGAALEVASTKLEPTNPIRLGLALNYSVCFFEILKNKKQACKLAKSAFDDAISKLDSLDEESYKDSTLIMQLLRDNLTLWSSDEHEL